jgi:hypothetical protein
MPCLGRIRSLLAEPTPTEGADMDRYGRLQQEAVALLAAVALLTG